MADLSPVTSVIVDSVNEAFAFLSEPVLRTAGKYLSKAIYFLNRKEINTEKQYLSLIKIFFRRYELKYDIGFIKSILSEHNMVIDYTRIKKIDLIRKIALICLRTKIFRL